VRGAAGAMGGVLGGISGVRVGEDVKPRRGGESLAQGVSPGGPAEYTSSPEGAALSENVLRVVRKTRFLEKDHELLFESTLFMVFRLIADVMFNRWSL